MVVDDDPVIARPAVHRVRPGAAEKPVAALAAVQYIIARLASQRIVAVEAAKRIAHAATDDAVGRAIAGAGERAHAGVFEDFDLIRQRITRERRLDPVAPAFARQFLHHIARVIDDIDVVVRPATHGVRPRAAVDHIIASKAVEQVIAGATSQCVRAGTALGLVGGATEDDIAFPGITGGIICPDNNVVIAIAVDIARARDRPAALVILVDTVYAETGGAVQAGKIETGSKAAGLAENDVAAADGEIAVQICTERSDDQIGEPIAVDIARTCYRRS